MINDWDYVLHYIPRHRITIERIFQLLTCERSLGRRR